jgi:hypothetical protein
MTLATDGGERVYAFTRSRDANTVFVAVNFGDAPVTVHYSGLSKPGSYRDWVDRAALVLDRSGTLGIPAHGYRLLVQ